MFNISVFTVMLPELTPGDAAAALQRHGYAGVEWRVVDEVRPSGSAGRLAYWGANRCTLPVNEESAIQARDLAAAHGLTIPGLGTYIDVGDLPPEVRQAGPDEPADPAQLPEDGIDLRAHLQRIERDLIEAALARSGGNKQQAARLLGAYGNSEIATSNIDALARSGVLFRHAFAASGVCSPTRAALLTGLMPSQTGIHVALPPQPELDGWSAIEEFRNLPQTLADAG